MLWAQISVDVFSTEQSWHPTWLWPWWALILVLLAAFVWIVWTYKACRDIAALNGRQRVLWWVLVTLRFTLFGLLVFFSMGWYPKTVEIDSPEVVLCFDLSESMNQRVRGNSSSDVPSTRLGRVKDALAKASWEGQGDWEFKWYGIGSKLRELPFSEEAWTSLEAADSESRLGDGLRDLLIQMAGRPVAAIVLVTDGINTEGPKLLDVSPLVKQRKVPVYTVSWGEGDAIQDAGIDLVTAPTHALVGETVLMEVGVDAREIVGKTLKLQMRQGTDDQLLQEQTWVPESKEAEKKFEFVQLMDQAGVQPYRFEVLVDGEDYNPTNDRKRLQIQVHEMQPRVLVVAGGPSWEFRFLKHTIERSMREIDEKNQTPFELDVLLQNADPRFSEIDSSALTVFPVSIEKLQQYDVILLLDPKTVSESPAQGLNANDCQHLLHYVQRDSGNLIWIAGPDFDARKWKDLGLEPLLPASAEDFTPSTSFLSRSDRVRVGRSKLGERMLPLQLERVDSRWPFEWQDGWKIGDFVYLNRIKPGTQILLESMDDLPVRQKAAPLLMLRNVGLGGTLFQSFSESYRLRYQRGDEVLNAYWSQWIQYFAKRRWLSRQEWREIRTNRWTYDEGETVQILARTLGADSESSRLPVRIWSDQGFQTELELLTGVGGPLDYTGEITGLMAGTYWVQFRDSDSDPNAQTQFEVRAQYAESDVVAVNQPSLDKIAKSSGGERVRVQELARLMQWLPPGEPLVVGERTGRSLWSRPEIVGLVGISLFGLLGIEWLLRGLLGR